MSAVRNSVVCDSKGYTDNGMKFIRLFNLQNVSDIEIVRIRDTNNVSAIFYFVDGTVVRVDNAFCIGYKGVGPRGLFEIAIECGMNVHDAAKVFTDTDSFVLSKISK